MTRQRPKRVDIMSERTAMVLDVGAILDDLEATRAELAEAEMAAKAHAEATQRALATRDAHCTRAVAAWRARAESAEKERDALRTLHAPEEWHEDAGFVLWHRLEDGVNLCEPPWCGTPLCDDWREGYFTHWSPLPIPIEPRASLDRLRGGAK